MMRSSVEVLDAYGSAFRDLINAKLSSSDKSVRELLRLNKEDDWNFICTAMDIIGDACAAVSNFLQFGLDGPTKYNDVGEKYLRLYGVLSATYIQQEAILKLYKLTQVPKPKDARDKIQSLRIREVRHKLGAHSTEYSSGRTDKIESYVPVRVSLSGFNCEYFNNETLASERVDLRECLNEHFEMLIALIDKVYEKTVKTLYKAEKKKLEEYMEKLKDLRIVRDGGLVITLPQGGKLIFQTMASRNLTRCSTRTRRGRRQLEKIVPPATRTRRKSHLS